MRYCSLHLSPLGGQSRLEALPGREPKPTASTVGFTSSAPMTRSLFPGAQQSTGSRTT
jgi:hypothetical protein